MDEYRRECLAIEVGRRMRSINVLETMARLFTTQCVPDYIRSDNGLELTAQLVRELLPQLEVGMLFIEPGSPLENGYVESFNGKLRDELLDRETFYTLRRSADSDQTLAGRIEHDPQVDDKIWLVSFMQYDQGFFDRETRPLESVQIPFEARVLPMSPV